MAFSPASGIETPDGLAASLAQYHDLASCTLPGLAPPRTAPHSEGEIACASATSSNEVVPPMHPGVRGAAAVHSTAAPVAKRHCAMNPHAAKTKVGALVRVNNPECNAHGAIAVVLATRRSNKGDLHQCGPNTMKDLRKTTIKGIGVMQVKETAPGSGVYKLCEGSGQNVGYMSLSELEVLVEGVDYMNGPDLSRLAHSDYEMVQTWDD